MHMTKTVLCVPIAGIIRIRFKGSAVYTALSATAPLLMFLVIIGLLFYYVNRQNEICTLQQMHGPSGLLLLPDG